MLETPAFEGDGLTFIVAKDLGNAPDTLLLSGATIDFGDGTTATGTAACTPQVAVAHAYRTAGDFDATVLAATSCDPATAVSAAAYADARVHVFPAAPAESANWPICSTFQLRLASPWSGAGLGNVATQITIHNVSARGCTLEGYPRIELIGIDGRFLPTVDRPATTGAYMFPAVVPHRVALAPDGFASFMVASGDTPFGPNDEAPQDVACPPSRAIRVTFPGTHQYGTAVVRIGACKGWVSESPIVPGAARIEFT